MNITLREVTSEDETLVGFVMLYDETLRAAPPEEPNIGLWRLMIDQRFQRRGIGREVVRQVVEHVRKQGVNSGVWHGLNNSNAVGGWKLLVLSSSLSAAADLSRYTAKMKQPKPTHHRRMGKGHCPCPSPAAMNGHA